jgi:iron(III) transport system permease protein
VQVAGVSSRDSHRTLFSRVRHSRVDLSAGLGLVITLGLLVLIVYPLVETVRMYFFPGGTFTLSPITVLLDQSAFLVSVKNTLIVVAVSGTSALIIGSVFAWLNERTDASFGAFTKLAPLVPLFIPPVALAIGWTLLAEPVAGFLNGYMRSALGLIGIHLTTGPLNINSWPGLLFVYTISLVPYAYLVVSPAFRNMDTSLEEASRMSGAGPLRTVLKVSLPAIAPAIAAAGLLIVIIGMALFSIPAIIGTGARIQTLSVYIVNLIDSGPSGLPLAVAAAALLFAFIFIVWLGHEWVASKTHRQVTLSGRTTTSAIVRLGRWRWVARTVLLLYLLAVSALPFVALVIVALQPYWSAQIRPSQFTLMSFKAFFEDPSMNLARFGLVTSLRLAAIGATTIIVIATIVVTFTHQAKGPVRAFVEAVTKIPAAISGLVIGVAILVTLGGSPFHLAGSLLILVLAYLVIFAPQGSLAAEAARGQVGDDLLEASWMTGGSRLRTSYNVLWPLMRPGLAYAWSMVFVLIMGDLTAAAILSGPGNPVVGYAILSIYTEGVYSNLAVLSIFVCLATLAAVGAVILVYGRQSRRRDSRIAMTESNLTS